MLTDYLPRSVVDNTYVYQGASARIAVKYQFSGGEYVHIPPEQQGTDILVGLVTLLPQLSFSLFNQRCICRFVRVLQLHIVSLW